MHSMNHRAEWVGRLIAAGLWIPVASIACSSEGASSGSMNTGGATTGGVGSAAGPAGGAAIGGGSGGVSVGKGGASVGGTLGTTGGAGGAPVANGGAAGRGATGAMSGSGGTSGGAAGTLGGASGASTGGVSGGSGGGTGGKAGGATGGKSSAATGGTSGGAGGATSGKGGAAAGGTGGASASGACTVGAWPTADPTKAGPYATTTETNVGPTSSDGTRFTLVRPTNLAETSLCHPIITWGNGSGATTSFYTNLLKQFASHGFIVISSDSGNVQQGNPYFQIAGAQWVIEQNDVASSPLYQRVDPHHVGATGHSRGGYATSEVGRDSRITTTAPSNGAIGSNQMKGPSLILCGGKDTFVPCDDDPLSAFNGTSGVAVMLANSHGADHTNWYGNLSDIAVAMTAWMRVQLMDDTALRNWFYGASCQLCADSDWTVQRKMMDQ